MNELFLKTLNMSIAASWLVLVVLIIRVALKNAPKWVNVFLWGIVAIRLICPFSIESTISLIPSTETIPLNIGMDTTPAINSGIEAINNVVNPIISQSNTPTPGASINPLQIMIGIYAYIWIFGMITLALYTIISYCRLRRKVDPAIIYRDNIFQSENVSSPFVLGIIKPRIYLPFKIEGQNLEHVIAHEQAHICRKDHWWKPLGFFLLTIHWFNPLMWLAYVVLCRDIELACDEKVIKELGNEQKADYTQALVSCSINRRTIAACPLAFGEVSVKERVKSIMNYKKPTFWAILMAFIVCVVVAVCFLINPSENQQYGKNPFGITLEVDNVTANGLTIVCKHSGGENVAELHTGSYYVIQKRGLMGWRDVEYVLSKDYDYVAWTDEALLIQKEGITQWDVNWEWLYGKLSAGEYRIGKEIMNLVEAESGWVKPISVEKAIKIAQKYIDKTEKLIITNYDNPTVYGIVEYENLLMVEPNTQEWKYVDPNKIIGRELYKITFLIEDDDTPIILYVDKYKGKLLGAAITM